MPVDTVEISYLKLIVDQQNKLYDVTNNRLDKMESAIQSIADVMQVQSNLSIEFKQVIGRLDSIDKRVSSNSSSIEELSERIEELDIAPTIAKAQVYDTFKERILMKVVKYAITAIAAGAISYFTGLKEILQLMLQGVVK